MPRLGRGPTGSDAPRVNHAQKREGQDSPIARMGADLGGRCRAGQAESIPISGAGKPTRTASQILPGRGGPHGRAENRGR